MSARPAPVRRDPARERDRALAARAASLVAPIEQGAPATAPARRRPQQARSQAKVGALLDATDALVIEVGIDALTTTLVADRARVAVGSLYQYFDGVPALVTELAARHTDQFQVRLEAALDHARFTRKRDVANVALDTLIDYSRDEPGFRALWRGAPAIVGARFDEAAEWLVAIVVRTLVRQGLVADNDAAFDREALIHWTTASALILLAFRLDPAGDPVVLAHLRHLFTLDLVQPDPVAPDLGPPASPS